MSPPYAHRVQRRRLRVVVLPLVAADTSEYAACPERERAGSIPRVHRYSGNRRRRTGPRSRYCSAMLERQERIVRKQIQRLSILGLAVALALVLEVPRAEHEVRAVDARRIDDGLAKQPYRCRAIPGCASTLRVIAPATSSAPQRSRCRRSTPDVDSRIAIAPSRRRTRDGRADDQHRADARQGTACARRARCPRAARKLLDGSSAMQTERDAEADHRLPPAKQRRRAAGSRRAARKPGKLREAEALRDLDLRRTVLGRQMRRPEEEPHPLRHDADRREHAIATGDVQCC